MVCVCECVCQYIHVCVLFVSICIHVYESLCNTYWQHVLAQEHSNECVFLESICQSCDCNICADVSLCMYSTIVLWICMLCLYIYLYSPSHSPSLKHMHTHSQTLHSANSVATPFAPTFRSCFPVHIHVYTCIAIVFLGIFLWNSYSIASVCTCT